MPYEGSIRMRIEGTYAGKHPFPHKIDDDDDCPFDATHCFILSNASNDASTESYIAYINGSKQMIYQRRHNWHHNYVIDFGRLVIKQHPTTLALSQLTLVPFNTKLLKNWVFVEHWMMSVVLFCQID